MNANKYNKVARQLHVTMTAEWIGERPDNLMSDMPYGSNHYRCVIRRGTKRMTVYFSMGPAHTSEPEADAVLESLIFDAGAAYETFEQFCDEMGYNANSRKAERTYKACVKIHKGLRRLFPDFAYDELFEMLNS